MTAEDPRPTVILDSTPSTSWGRWTVQCPECFHWMTGSPTSEGALRYLVAHQSEAHYGEPFERDMLTSWSSGNA